MNAVVEISGKQFKVSKDSKLYVHRLDAKEGSKVSFENVLLLDNGKKLIVGTPNVQGASVLKFKISLEIHLDKSSSKVNLVLVQSQEHPILFNLMKFNLRIKSLSGFMKTNQFQKIHS